MSLYFHCFLLIAKLSQAQPEVKASASAEISFIFNFTSVWAGVHAVWAGVHTVWAGVHSAWAGVHSAWAGVHPGKVAIYIQNMV